MPRHSVPNFKQPNEPMTTVRTKLRAKWAFLCWLLTPDSCFFKLRLDAIIPSRWPLLFNINLPAAVFGAERYT